MLEFQPDRERIRQFLHAAMRRCYPGAPVLVDQLDENAATLAASLDRAATEGVPESPPLVREPWRTSLPPVARREAGRLSPCARDRTTVRTRRPRRAALPGGARVFEDPERDVVAWIERKELVRKFEDALDGPGSSPLGWSSSWAPAAAGCGLLARRPRSSG